MITAQYSEGKTGKLGQIIIYDDGRLIRKEYFDPIWKQATYYITTSGDVIKVVVSDLRQDSNTMEWFIDCETFYEDVLV